MLSASDYIDCIQRSYIDAVNLTNSLNTVDYKNLSSLFIKTIHNHIVSMLSKEGDSNMVCFSNRIENNEFRRSEFLFDIHVCEKGFTTSAIRRRAIAFIKKSHVVIESEFSENLTESIIDYSKLVCSNAPLKIMILPNSMNENEKNNYLMPLTPITQNIFDEHYCIFIPHPRKWRYSKPDLSHVKIYKSYCGSWNHLNMNTELEASKPSIALTSFS